MRHGAYLTPKTAPDTYECRAVFIPAGAEWWAIFTGALNLLTLADSYEQSTNGLPPEDVAAIFGETFYAWTGEECPMFPGMVVAAACAAVNSSRWLLCDGAAYGTDDYPALYAAIGTNFGVGGAGTFRVPQLGGRMPIGVGVTSGLSERNLADVGGAETVTLSGDQMPGHDHSINSYISWGATPGAEPVSVVNPLISDSTGNAGGGENHENMPPFIALNFFIYTG
jgi:microcystin-dependent protein